MSGRKKIQASFLNRMDFFERKFTPLMFKAIRSQIKEFISDMKTNGIEGAKRNIDKIIINTEVSDVVMKIYKTVGVDAANTKYREIIEQVPRKSFGFNAEWAAEIINYFKLYLLNKAVIPISQSTREQIRTILILGESKGWGVDEIARKLLETELTLWRARMIVRTESAKAAFEGREVAKKKQPYHLTTEWIAAHDHRTRHSHRLIDGKVVNYGQKFAVPVYKKIGKIDMQVGVDYMAGPGDPKAHASNVINCRCTTAERVVFDNEGNPGMKNETINKEEKIEKADYSEILTPMNDISEGVKNIYNQVNRLKNAEVDITPVIEQVGKVDEIIGKKTSELIDEIYQSNNKSATEVKTWVEKLLKEISGAESEKIDSLVDILNSKEYSPNIEVKADNETVLTEIGNVKNELIKALKELKDEMKRKKKWELKIIRDSNDLITSIQADEK